MRRWLTLAVLIWLSGCAAGVSSGYGQGGRDVSGRSYEEARADNLISARVTELLLRDREVRAIDIKVRTYHAVVTLSGSVPSAGMVPLAAKIAAKVEGVKRVDNQLSVKP